MNQGEFKQLLSESGLPKEFSQILNSIVRAVNENDERLISLEMRIVTLEKNGINKKEE